MTPSALATLEPAAVPSLSRVISVGEACPPDLMRRWARAGRAFFNLYGPTEVTNRRLKPLRGDALGFKKSISYSEKKNYCKPIKKG